MTESRTARGAYLLTALLLLAAAVAFRAGLPPGELAAASPAQVVALLQARSTFALTWLGQVVTGLGVVAAIWGVYGARNVPAPGTWRSAAPTSAQLSRGVLSTAPPSGEAP